MGNLKNAKSGQNEPTLLSSGDSLLVHEQFINKVQDTISNIQDLAKDTFCLIAEHDSQSEVSKAVLSAASTHATLGGNLATSAESVANAVLSAASTHATLGGNLATSADSVANAVVSAATTHATLGGNLATSANSVSGHNLMKQEYLGYFRTLILTMLGEIPLRGHLISDFEDMFNINYEKKLTLDECDEIAKLIKTVKQDWCGSKFLNEDSEVLTRMRLSLLRIAEIMDMNEIIPDSFTESDMEVVPHIGLLNDFLDNLLSAMDVKTITYREDLKNNEHILESAKQIVENHRSESLPLGYKMLRTALLENTAQARINGLRTIAEPYGLGDHIYLTTHDIVEAYHGRDSLDELTNFVNSGHSTLHELNEHLESIVSEIKQFYSGILRSLGHKQLLVG